MSDQKYKIFVNNKEVFLVSNPAQVNEIVSSEEHFIIQPYKKKEWDNLMEIILGKDNPSHVVAYHPNVSELWDIFRAYFEPVVAAGGVVIQPDKRILMIFRRGSWDLPKGKLETGETLEACALREVEEETGIRELSIILPIRFRGLSQDCTYHVYFEKGKWCLKSSFWYLMEIDHAQEIIPQTEEDIEIAEWVPLMESLQRKPIYSSIHEVLSAISNNTQYHAYITR